MPFWTVCTNRARAWISIDPARLHFLSVLLGTLVDLYLVTADAGERAGFRQEHDAGAGSRSQPAARCLSACGLGLIISTRLAWSASP